MPPLGTVLDSIRLKKINVETEYRHNVLRALYKYTKHDTIIYIANFNSPGGNQIGDQDINMLMNALHGLKGDKLDLIIHSPGGLAEAAAQIVNYLRCKYKYIRAIIPHKAMSAATMLACGCDEIVMGKHSAIGPIDPQIYMPNSGRIISAQSILDEFDAAKQEVLNNPNSAVFWSARISNYPIGFYNECISIIEYSKKQVREWLETRMLKDNPEGASNVADYLGNAKNHKSHGNPICINNPGIKDLKITTLESDQKLQDLVLTIFHVCDVAFNLNQKITKIIENQHGKGMTITIQS